MHSVCAIDNGNKVRQAMGVANTKVRGVRVDDELWKKALAKAKDRRESVADVIRRALLAYTEDDK